MCKFSDYSIKFIIDFKYALIKNIYRILFHYLKTIEVNSILEVLEFLKNQQTKPKIVQ